MTAKRPFRVFVGNLSTVVDDKRLLETFEVCGAVSAKVAKDRRTGKGLGYAHVEFETEEEMRSAVKAMDGVALAERTISVYEDKVFQGKNKCKGTRRSGIAAAAAAAATAEVDASQAAQSSGRTQAKSPTGNGKVWDGWIEGLSSSFKGLSKSASVKNPPVSRSKSMGAKSVNTSPGLLEGPPQLNSSRSQKAALAEEWQRGQK